MIFEIDKRFEKAINEFITAHDSCERTGTGEKFSYKFILDAFSLRITVKCEICGEELDLIEFLDENAAEGIEESDTVIFSFDKE